MTMDEFQKYREIKDLVESSYPDKTECKNIWASVRHLLLYYSEYEFRKNQLEVFSQILETGKPLCHLDFYRGYEDDDPIFDLLDKPFVSFPFTQCLWECDTEKNLYRFFFVNPDVHGAKDFTFKSKLALRDTDIILTSSDNNAARMQDSVCFENLQLPETSKFIVCCEANSKSIQFGGVFEVQHAAEGKEILPKDENSLQGPQKIAGTRREQQRLAMAGAHQKKLFIVRTTFCVFICRNDMLLFKK